MSKKIVMLCAICMLAVSAIFAGCGQDADKKQQVMKKFYM